MTKPTSTLSALLFACIASGYAIPPPTQNAGIVLHSNEDMNIFNPTSVAKVGSTDLSVDINDLDQNGLGSDDDQSGASSDANNTVPDDNISQNGAKSDDNNVHPIETVSNSNDTGKDCPSDASDQKCHGKNHGAVSKNILEQLEDVILKAILRFVRQHKKHAVNHHSDSAPSPDHCPLLNSTNDNQTDSKSYDVQVPSKYADKSGAPDSKNSTQDNQTCIVDSVSSTGPSDKQNGGKPAKTWGYFFPNTMKTY